MVEFAAVGTNKQKGNSLEHFFSKVLSSLGYINLKPNVKTTGKEVDIQGTNRLITHSVRCECKAHQLPIGSNLVKKFFADVHKEVSHNPKITGIFVSTSGFKGTALEWYDELADKDKEYFKIMDENALFSELQSSGLICSENELKLSVSMKTRIPNKKSKIILSERGIFWEVTLEDIKSGELYFILLDSYGKELKRSDSDYLLSMDEMASKNYVSLEVKKEILIELLNPDYLTVDKLVSALEEPKYEISASIANLKAEKFIDDKSGKISLRNEIDSFLGIARYLNDENEIVTFMSSNYFNSNLKSIIRYIESKFVFKFTDDEKNKLSELISVSPKALTFCLFGDSTSYVTNAEHLEQLSLDVSEKENHESKSRLKFLIKLSRYLMVDIETNANKDLMIKNKVDLIKLGTEVILTRRFQPILKVRGEIFLSLYKVGGPIKAGQLVSAKGPGTIFKIADSCLTIGELDKALKEYDFIIESWPDNEDAISTAIHNKGLVYMNQGKFHEAINEFEKVRFKKFVRPTVLENLCICYLNLNLTKPFQNTLMTLVRKWPEEAETLKNELQLL